MTEQHSQITGRGLALIGLLGGLGGAINAWLCYAKIPVPVMGLAIFGRSESIDFHWYVTLGGAAHGGLLALLSVGFARKFWKHRWLFRWAAWPVVGWLAGWVSCIPLNLSLSEEFSGHNVLKSLTWPFELKLETLWVPYLYFGLVSLLYYFLLNICRQLAATRLSGHLLLGSVAGCVGSLWWWIVFGPWYFSLIHGTIWGSLVGFGLWKATRRQRD